MARNTICVPTHTGATDALHILRDLLKTAEKKEIFRPHVVVHDSPALVSLLRKDGLPVEPLTEKGSPPGRPGTTWQIMQFMAHQKVSAVLCTDFVTTQAWSGIARMTMKPAAGFVSRPFPGGFRARIRAGQAKSLLCATPEVKQSLPLQLFSRGRIWCPPVAGKRKQGKARKKAFQDFSVSGEDILVGLFAPLNRDFSALFQGLRRFSESAPGKVHLILCGEGEKEERKALKEQAHAAGLKHVHIFAPQKRPEEKLSTLDLLVVPGGHVPLFPVMFCASAGIPLLVAGESPALNLLEEGRPFRKVAADDPAAIAEAAAALFKEPAAPLDPDMETAARDLLEILRPRRFSLPFTGVS